MTAVDQNVDVSASRILKCGSIHLNLDSRTLVMGILNVTPDSFFDGGRYTEKAAAIEHGLRLAEDGADIIDIGGESTRPGADPVEVDEEIWRVVPVIKALSRQVNVPISIDTRKATVAEAALDAGARMINDISGLRYDGLMAGLAGSANVPIVLMHIKGNPKDMQNDTGYDNLVLDIRKDLNDSATMALEAGVSRENIIIDPGIGFGKAKPDNFILLDRLEEFMSLGYPLLLGVSRKSFIGWALDLPENERLIGTAAAVAACVLRGADIVRVHDVKEMSQAVRIADCIRRAPLNSSQEG